MKEPKDEEEATIAIMSRVREMDRGRYVIDLEESIVSQVQEPIVIPMREDPLNESVAT